MLALCRQLYVNAETAPCSLWAVVCVRVCVWCTTSCPSSFCLSCFTGFFYVSSCIQ